MKRPPLKVIGPSIVYIPLTRGFFALVDDISFGRVFQHDWIAHKGKTSDGSYAFANIRDDAGVQHPAFMHRVIAGLQPRDGKKIDHINGNGLDNRVCNLRECSHEENMRNRRMGKNNTTGLKGIYLDRNSNLWKATISVKGRTIHLGKFSDKEAAHEAYASAAQKLHGEFARP